jgi:hypothetical protein
MVEKNLQNTRVVWTDMYGDKEDRPKNFYQSEEHYKAMRYIQEKYPHGVKIFEKDGKMKNVKYWKKVYKPATESSLENFL